MSSNDPHSEKEAGGRKEAPSGKPDDENVPPEPTPPDPAASEPSGPAPSPPEHPVPEQSASEPTVPEPETSPTPDPHYHSSPAVRLASWLLAFVLLLVILAWALSTLL